MKPPPTGPNESDRLNSLREYDVLDSEMEEAYDQATALAALICETPFSLVTLVDQDRQWFKSRHGWQGQESDRAISFCAHAMYEPDFLVVPDATMDDRFRDNPYVTGGPRIRFYAGAPLVSPEGHPLGSVCVLDRVPRQLTPDQKQALQVLRNHVMTLLELRRSQRRLDLSDEILDSLPGVFYMFDREGRFLRWNRRLEQLTGYSSEEIAELHPLDLFRGPGREHIEERIQRAFQKGAAEAEADLVTRDGSTIRHYFTGRVLKFRGEPLLVGMGIDVSKHRELEAERERLFNLSPDPVCIVGFDGKFRDVSPACERVLGYSRDELLGRSYFEFLHPDDRDRALEELEGNVGGGESRNFESRYAHRDGGWRWLSWNSSVDETRGVIYAMARDVTHEKEVIAALRQSEERYRTLVESARDAIVTMDAGGTIASVNRAAEVITGWPQDSWPGRTLEELVHPDDLPLARQMLEKLGSEEEVPVFELRVVGAGGAEIPAELKAAAVEVSEGERRILVIARDIRERKALDERLHRISRLDAVGRLAAGVAHDFNNVLTVIRAESDLLLVDGGLPDDAAESVHEIRSAAGRGADLAGRLMGLSRRREPRFEAVELNAVVRRFDSMLDRLVGSSCEIRRELCAEPTTLRADPGMLEQVLMNLAINARDAMPEGGVVTVSTRRTHVDDQMARVRPDAHVGPYLCLSVADTGTGIAPEDQSRVFEPLFTTKKEGEGTGLGLATVHTIVQKHGGWVDLESKPGAGTTFELYFPAGASSARSESRNR